MSKEKTFQIWNGLCWTTTFKIGPSSTNQCYFSFIWAAAKHQLVFSSEGNDDGSVMYSVLSLIKLKYILLGIKWFTFVPWVFISTAMGTRSLSTTYILSGEFQGHRYSADRGFFGLTSQMQIQQTQYRIKAFFGLRVGVTMQRFICMLLFSFSGEGTWEGKTVKKMRRCLCKHEVGMWGGVRHVEVLQVRGLSVTETPWVSQWDGWHLADCIFIFRDLLHTAVIQ